MGSGRSLLLWKGKRQWGGRLRGWQDERVFSQGKDLEREGSCGAEGGGDGEGNGGGEGYMYHGQSFQGWRVRSYVMEPPVKGFAAMAGLERTFNHFDFGFLTA